MALMHPSISISGRKMESLLLSQSLLGDRLSWDTFRGKLPRRRDMIHLIFMTAVDGCSVTLQTLALLHIRPQSPYTMLVFNGPDYYSLWQPMLVVFL